jgi:hypothetical protein
MRLLAFIISVMLLAGWIDPTQEWLITFTVVTGLEAVRFRFWSPLYLRPAFDFRMAAFIFAALLLSGTVDATRDWLIATTIVTGIAMVAPRLISLEPRRTGLEIYCWPRTDWNAEGWR